MYAIIVKSILKVIKVDTVKNQITDFLNKCEEIKNCKFIMATTKFKDLLKSIVNSAELYELFNTVASNFDYIAAKRECFVEGDAYGRCRVILPDTVGDRLAFIFCLLVEFDRNDINFNAFLQKYYPKDGSYYASYHLFCDEVIDSLQAIICDIFSKELAEEEQPLLIPSPEQQAQLIAEREQYIAFQQQFAPAPQIVQSAQNAQSNGAPAEVQQGANVQIDEQSPAQAITDSANVATKINTLNMLIESERQAIASSPLSQEDREAADSLLTSLASAVREGDAPLIKSLTCGYNYLLMQTNFASESISDLFDGLGELVASL